MSVLEIRWCTKNVTSRDLYKYQPHIPYLFTERPSVGVMRDRRSNWGIYTSHIMSDTGWHGGLEHLKIETRLRDERFQSVKCECVIYVEAIGVSSLFNLIFGFVCCLLWVDKTRAKDKAYIWVSVRWKTKTYTWGIYTPRMHWGARQNKIETPSPAALQGCGPIKSSKGAEAFFVFNERHYISTAARAPPCRRVMSSTQ